MSEETTSGEPKYTYVDPSPATSLYRAHREAMEPLPSLPQDKSFCVPMEGLLLPLLRNLATDSSVGKKAYVVIPHMEHDVYEIYRLVDGGNIKTFYKTQTKTTGAKITAGCNPVDEIKRVCQTYVTLNHGECLKYDPKLHVEAKRQKIISYTYIQRRLVSAAAFRNSANGATQALKDGVSDLVEEGFLKELTKEESKSNYNTKGKLFEISLN